MHGGPARQNLTRPNKSFLCHETVRAFWRHREATAAMSRASAGLEKHQAGKKRMRLPEAAAQVSLRSLRKLGCVELSGIGKADIPQEALIAGLKVDV